MIAYRLVASNGNFLGNSDELEQGIQFLHENGLFNFTYCDIVYCLLFICNIVYCILLYCLLYIVILFVGILLHYDDPALSDVYFVDPQWLCSMLACVVTIHQKNPFQKNGTS